jgi:hypothetical protein
MFWYATLPQRRVSHRPPAAIHKAARSVQVLQIEQLAEGRWQRSAETIRVEVAAKARNDEELL